MKWDRKEDLRTSGCVREMLSWCNEKLAYKGSSEMQKISEAAGFRVSDTVFSSGLRGDLSPARTRPRTMAGLWSVYTHVRLLVEQGAVTQPTNDDLHADDTQDEVLYVKLERPIARRFKALCAKQGKMQKQMVTEALGYLFERHKNIQ